MIALLIAIVPGIGEVRVRFAEARPGWLALMVVLEICSCLSCVAAFKGFFCARLDWRFSYEVGMAEQGTNLLVPAGVLGGLALTGMVVVAVPPRALHRIDPDHDGPLREDDLPTRARRFARRAAAGAASGIEDAGMLLRRRQPYALLCERQPEALPLFRMPAR